MSTLNTANQESNSRIHYPSNSSSTSEDEDEEFLDEDDSNDRANESTNNRKKTKKTLGRVKIKMAYIDNKIRRYTTFSKRKTGIMKKAYELATLTGTEVMLLVASETGHVYTFATAKLQPMITSETGKALIQTCLAKDEPVVETIPETPITTLNNNDVICIDESQRKKRINSSLDPQSSDLSTVNRPIKRPKLKSVDDISKMKSIETSSSSTPKLFSSQSSTTIPLSIPSFHTTDSQPVNPSVPSSYTIDLNTLKANGMNIIFAPTTTNPSESSSTSSPSNIPLVLTLANLPYQPS